MFTGKTIRISDLPTPLLSGLAIIRDCAFAYIGKVPSAVSPRLVPCTKQEHLHNAAGTLGISGVITTAALSDSVPKQLGLALSIDPVSLAYAIHHYLTGIPDLQWMSFPSRISDSAIVHPSSEIPPRDVIIGENSIIHPGAIIFPRTIIGRNSSIGAGTVVGCDAFEVDATKQPHRILAQAGGVRIGDYVDIQAKCTIVRSTFGGFTEIGDETKLDCQVHLAHDCSVGKQVRIAACAEISGRVNIGDRAFIGPNASLSNGICIGSGAHVTIGAVVTRDVADDAHVSGNFAIEHSKWLNLMRKVR